VKDEEKGTILKGKEAQELNELSGRVGASNTDRAPDHHHLFGGNDG